MQHSRVIPEKRKTNKVSPIIATAFCLENFQPVAQKEETQSPASHRVAEFSMGKPKLLESEERNTVGEVATQKESSGDLWMHVRKLPQGPGKKPQENEP